MNEVLKTIKNRRSVRKYKKKQITDEELNAVITAGQYAPSGGNCQFSHFTVIQNKEVLDNLKRIVIEEFGKMDITEGMYKSKANAIKQAKSGKYEFLYDAPTFIIVSNKKGHPNAMADSVSAIENMLIGATSINLGSCWINQLAWLTDNANLRNYVEKLGISNNEVICGGLVLGYSNQVFLKPIERTGNAVSIIK